MTWAVNPNSCVALRIIALHELRRRQSELLTAIDVSAGRAIMRAVPIVYPPMKA